MKLRYRLLSVILVLAVLPGCIDHALPLPGLGPIEPQPRMEIPESQFDFGYAPQYATISHGFWLHSTGDEALRILKVVPG